MVYFNRKGEEVKLGDAISNVETYNTSLGKVKTIINIIVDKDNIDELVKSGFLYARNCKKITLHLDPEYYINKVSNKVNILNPDTVGMLSFMWCVFPKELFSGFLKMVAIEIDKKYPNHITEIKEFYTVDKIKHIVYGPYNANIVPKDFYLCHAVFRSKEDAELGVKITKNIIKYFNE